MTPSVGLVVTCKFRLLVRVRFPLDWLRVRNIFEPSLTVNVPPEPSVLLMFPLCALADYASNKSNIAAKVVCFIAVSSCISIGDGAMGLCNETTGNPTKNPRAG